MAVLCDFMMNKVSFTSVVVATYVPPGFKDVYVAHLPGFMDMHGLRDVMLTFNRRESISICCVLSLYFVAIVVEICVAKQVTPIFIDMNCHLQP